MRWQPMVDRLDPVGLRYRASLRVRNRDDRHRCKRGKYRLQFGEIEPTMQGRHERCGLTRKQGKRIVVQMKVHEVKLIGLAPHLFQHRQVQSYRIANRLVETQCAWPNGLKLRRCS